MHAERLSQVCLGLVPGVGPITIRQLISYCGSAGKVFTTSPLKLSKIPGIGPKTANTIHSSNYLIEARVQLEKAKSNGISVYFYTDKQYPNRLKALEDAPILLYAQGKPAFNNPRTIGIVGTRRATVYGKQVVSRLLNQLKSYQPTIVSGLAYGIDICAHREALKLDLPTVAVLGSGLDYIYPNVHKNTATEMLANGGLISELKFGTKPEMYHFPSRNRIIAGLSDALIVVEARKTGGALITADFMKKYKKPCYAVPGPITNPTSQGSNYLIKKRKATILTAGEDVVQQLGWDRHKSFLPPQAESISEKNILEILRNNPEGLHIDELCRKAQIPINKVGVFILNLEMQGQVKSVPGKKFLLVQK